MSLLVCPAVEFAGDLIKLRMVIESPLNWAGEEEGHLLKCLETVVSF